MANLKEICKVVALLIFCIGVPCILWLLLRNAPDRGGGGSPPTNAELITIVLAGVTVVLAVLAIVVAILAVWGYQSIKNEAAHLAEVAVREQLTQIVGKHVNLESIQAAVRKEIAKKGLERNDYPGAFYGGDPEQGTVGTEYPKDRDVNNG